ncbi:PREDICTED: ankyrin repeat domain-containing protein 35-like [Thamnophis sirtalis]|uniref:Ankyrin repeat domain-containing protein 35-like n=1 Tax=Thamnophis sirtalis TaxID=35019 RepID=A0A6I9YMZ3_9SAUR|nr:PREDICTED: ankyrin repeat domain-containing protein 35-like [Thamnophis sirtalis]
MGSCNRRTDPKLFIKSIAQTIWHYAFQALQCPVRLLKTSGTRPGVAFLATNDRTPLMIAAQGNHTAICSQLLQRGAKVDLPDKDGKTQNPAILKPLIDWVQTSNKWFAEIVFIKPNAQCFYSVPSESGKDTDVSSLAFQSEAGDQSDDEEEAEEGSELREWRSRFREEKMKVIQLELQLDQKTKDCQLFSKDCQLLKEKVWDQVQEISQLLPDREGRSRDWRLLSRDLTEGDHCLDLLAQQVQELKERKKQQEAEKELPKASTQGVTSPAKLQPGIARWPGEEEAEELKRLQSELEAALEGKATAARRVEEMEGHMENMRAVIGVFEAKKKSQNAALKEMEARTQQLGEENRKLRGLLGKHLAGPPESGLAQAKVAQCIKEMEETQFKAREEMVAMLAENEDLKKEAEEAVRSRLQFQAVPSGAVKKCVAAWKKVVTGLEGALAKLEEASSALLDKVRPLQEAILEPPSKTLVNGNGLPEEEKNGHQPARSETLEELQKSEVEKAQIHNGLVGQVKLRPKPEGVENKARPCRRSSDLEKEVWDLKQSNGGLAQELAQLSREREKLQEQLQKLHGPAEGSPRVEKTERLVDELKQAVEVLSEELSLEKEESGKLRLKLQEQRKEVAFVRNNFLKKVSQEAGGIVGDNLDSCILKELHWKLDNVVKKQNEALQLVSEMEEENRALEADRNLPLDPRSPDDGKTGQDIFLEASEVIGENWKVREQMVELEKGLQEMKKLLVASQVTQGGLKAASLMQLLDRVLAQMADLRREEEQVLGKYEKICSMLSTRAQVLGEELAALREKYEEANGASAHHKDALDRELRKTQELMAEALEHEEEVEELRGKSQKLESTVDKLNKKVDDIAKMCQERDGKIKKLLKETEKLSSEILNLRSERTRLILQNEVAQKNHQEIVSIYRTHLLNAAQGYMDEEVHAMLLRILRTD